MIPMTLKKLFLSLLSTEGGSELNFCCQRQKQLQTEQADTTDDYIVK